MVRSWAGYRSINLAWLARCLAERGEFGEGVAAGREAVAIAEGLENPYVLVAACLGLGYVSLVKEDLDTAGVVLERGRTVASEANLALYRPQATRLLGAVHLVAGRIEEAVALVRAAADEVESRNLLMQHATVLTLLGEVNLASDRLEGASAAAQRALTLARERGQRGDEAAALHVLAEVTARGFAEVETAIRHYQAAIALAGELTMRPLLARCYLDLGRLYLQTGDRARAEEHLMLAERLFTEMDMPLGRQTTAAAL